MVEHHALLYRDLADPVALLRRERGGNGALAATGPMPGWRGPPRCPMRRSPPTRALMAASQPFIAEEVLAAFDFSRLRCLLDLGGGDGASCAPSRRGTPISA